ncbi:MAG TPA: UrcA family protein [Phenylobacterium sp.]|jgi:UrcA family protein|nr:UrcA family protein [Phenylobacterium sp.]
MNRYFLGAALAAISLACGGAAFAQPSQSPDVMVVRLSDLNTGHADGAQAALHRIKSAAVKFCGDDGSRDLNRQYEQERCVARMTDKAVQSLGAAEVTALYIAKGAIRTDDVKGAILVASRDPR